MADPGVATSAEATSDQSALMVRLPVLHSSSAITFGILGCGPFPGAWAALNSQCSYFVRGLPHAVFVGGPETPCLGSFDLGGRNCGPGVVSVEVELFSPVAVRTTFQYVLFRWPT